ncbi:carbohydrate ABC transporter permease [Caloranaerobacter ferrireducens]|uniref:carbohydrate ABC transporter permease n=1 Tax=Caloranaerobacter ferrireducens TaxID=1323370 RepID=UPI00084DCA9F|nr:sugar ABC transporter permease [Caloranaerobacter ferrireducens]
MLKKLRKSKGFLFILPSLIGFSILYVIPFIGGLKYSVSRSGFDDTFVAFKNYNDVFKSNAFNLALKNTALFMGIAIPLIIIISFILALIIYEIKAPNFIKLFIILPMAIPSGTVAGFFRKVFGFGGFNLIDTEYAMIVVILIFIWRNTGYNLIIYLAGLSQLRKEIIEASMIDGANYFQRLWHIIIPLITPTTVFVGIVTIINSFKVFKDIFILQGSYPNPKIYMLQHYMNNKFRDLQYEKLTSAAYVFAIVIFAFAFLLFLLDKKHAKRVGES